VRDEGDKITMSLKVINGDKIEDQKETCIEVGNFHDAVSILEMVGCQKKAFQESNRELWKLDGIEITIDEWPFLKPFVEVEGKSEESVKRVSIAIGFDYAKALFCQAGVLYERKYKISNEIIWQIPQIVFGGENPFLNLK